MTSQRPQGVGPSPQTRPEQQRVIEDPAAPHGGISASLQQARSRPAANSTVHFSYVEKKTKKESAP
jgi:hypothetical protein